MEGKPTQWNISDISHTTQGSVDISILYFRYLEDGDVPGEALHSFAQLASLQSLLLPKSRKILMEVHAWKTQRASL